MKTVVITGSARGLGLDMAKYLARQTELYLSEILHTSTPSVEQIQDAVEKILIENGHARTRREWETAQGYGIQTRCVQKRDHCPDAVKQQRN